MPQRASARLAGGALSWRQILVPGLPILSRRTGQRGSRHYFSITKPATWLAATALERGSDRNVDSTSFNNRDCIMSKAVRRTTISVITATTLIASAAVAFAQAGGAAGGGGGGTAAGVGGGGPMGTGGSQAPVGSGGTPNSTSSSPGNFGSANSGSGASGSGSVNSVPSR